MLRDHRLGFARRRPAIGLPPVRNDAIGEGADHHEDEIDHAQGGEGFPHADIGRGLEVVDQEIGQRRADHGAAAEAHDGHAGRHAAAVREPFDQRRDRRDVAEAKADAADHAGAQPHDPELVDVNAEGADHEAAAPAQRGDDTGFARAGAFKPAAPDRGRDAEHDKEQGVHPAHARDFPVAGGGEEFLHQRNIRTGFRRGQADRARQRQPEHGKSVGHADAQMNAKRRRWHQPAVESGLRDRVLAIENSRSVTRHCPSALIVVIQSSPAQQPIAGHVCCSATLITKFSGIVLSLLFVLCTISRAPLSHGAPSGELGQKRARVSIGKR